MSGLIPNRLSTPTLLSQVPDRATQNQKVSYSTEEIKTDGERVRDALWDHYAINIAEPAFNALNNNSITGNTTTFDIHVFNNGQQDFIFVGERSSAAEDAANPSDLFFLDPDTDNFVRMNDVHDDEGNNPNNIPDFTGGRRQIGYVAADIGTPDGSTLIRIQNSDNSQEPRHRNNFSSAISIDTTGETPVITGGVNGGVHTLLYPSSSE